jgi:Gpi18-like mannosyltransferase
MQRPISHDVKTSAQPVRFRDGAVFCLAVFVSVRIALSIIAALSVGSVTPPGGATSGDEVPSSSGLHNIVDGTDRWDALWFERIARDGYRSDDASAAFFPGYPIVIRAVDVITPLGVPGSALLVSNAAFLAALIVLYALTAREWDSSTARRTVILLACFPSSFFFLAPYSESLYLLCSVLAFWWVRQERWGPGSVAGVAAAITRSLGVVLVPAFLVEAWRSRTRARAMVLACAPLLAPLAYGAYWLISTGDALQPLHAQDAWFRTFQLALITMVDAVRLGIQGVGDPRGIYWTADLLLTVVLVTPLLVRWRQIPVSYLVYAGATVLVVLSYPLPARPLLSAPRLLLILFPCFWAMALVFRDRSFVLASAVFAFGFVALSITFVTWGFVF